MAKVSIDTVVEMIRAARARPLMYFVVPHPHLVCSWLVGLRSGLSLAGLDWSPEHRAAVLRRRGLALTADWEVKELRRRGWPDERIADELLLIEEEMWLRAKDAA